MWTSLVIGLLASTSPCVLPLYPGFLAYLSGHKEARHTWGSRYMLGFFVLAGVLTMMLALGGIIALLSVSVGRALSLVIPLADLVILILGVLLILNHNPFRAIPQIQVSGVSHPFASAFLYGLLYGPIALPCSGPLVVGIFAYSLSIEEAISKLGVFLWFGLGFGLPLLLLSFLSGAAARQIAHYFVRNARIVNIAGGFLLVGLAVYDLSVNWTLIRAFFPS